MPPNIPSLERCERKLEDQALRVARSLIAWVVRGWLPPVLLCSILANVGDLENYLATH